MAGYEISDLRSKIFDFEVGVKGEASIKNVRSQNSCSFRVLRFQFSHPPIEGGKERCGAVKEAGMGSERDDFVKPQAAQPCQLSSSTEMEET